MILMSAHEPGTEDPALAASAEDDPAPAAAEAAAGPDDGWAGVPFPTIDPLPETVLQGLGLDDGFDLRHLKANKQKYASQPFKLQLEFEPWYK